jgi:Holliday junction DNA helicase RuvA
MISFIQGKIIKKGEDSVTILTSGGVGYDVNCRMQPSSRAQAEGIAECRIGDGVGLYTYLAVRENAMELYGFEKEEERELFLKFLDVSGVGPKTAMHLLSLGTVDEISSAIGRGDVDYLTKVSGIGKKTAERIVVELKSKVQKSVKSIKSGDGEVLGDVVGALVGLGYSREEAREAVKELDSAGKDSGKLLKEALKRLGK